MNKTETVHKSVLLKESIEGLDLTDNSVFIDGTFGGGGHTLEIVKKYKDVKVIAFDQDRDAWSRAKSKFKGTPADITFVNKNFRDIDTVLKSEGVEEVDAILLDLGLSSDQLESAGRGFSIIRDEPLLMTFKTHPKEEDLTAKDIVNTWSEENIADIIYGYGEEQFSRRIANGIIEARKIKKIETTFDLVKIIEESVPAFYKKGRIHCATKTFQALRIAVNDELNTLEIGLRNGFDVLKIKGRLVVISFHSLEDRIVKRFFKSQETNGKVILINKKPIIAGVDELKENTRARSAKLRILEKINN